MKAVEARSLGQHELILTKRMRIKVSYANDTNYFDSLPDDLLLLILSKVSSSAERPADILHVQAICKRMKALSIEPIVLNKATSMTSVIRAGSWCDSTHRFLKLCAESGNLESSYMLGMIQFYCLQSRRSGVSLMVTAAINSHPPALYSLAVIHFNGSGGSKFDKDSRFGAALCARAAYLNHVEALREYGHCLQDGHGVTQNILEGRKFLIKADACELHARCSNISQHGHEHLLSDFGFDIPSLDPHPANVFLTEWFAARSYYGGNDDDGLRLCSHEWCGRLETRKREFRRCSVCGTANYCSRACQAMDWKLRHKAECAPLDR